MRPAAGLGAALLFFASSAMAEEAKKGMPQLDFHNPLTISQVVWLAIIFLALYLLLSRWALPQVAEVLDSRARSIAADLDAARGAKQAADAAIAELTEATRTAQAGARSQIAEAVEQAKAAAASQSAALDARIETQLAAAETQIAAARAAALGALREVATEATTVLVGRLTGAAADSASVDSAVGAALAARAPA
jgi:F-type H+-transporting ATPase subunit b